MGALPDSYQQAAEGVELGGFDHQTEDSKTIATLCGTIQENTDHLLIIPDLEDTPCPKLIPVQVNKKKQTRLVAATSAPQKSSKPGSSAAPTTSGSKPGGGKKSTGGLGTGSGDGGDEEDGEDEDKKNKGRIDFTASDYGSYRQSSSSSSSARSRSGKSQPHKSEHYHNGRRITYTHRGNITVVDHAVGVKDDFHTSTPRGLRFRK